MKTFFYRCLKCFPYRLPPHIRHVTFSKNLLRWGSWISDVRASTPLVLGWQVCATTPGFTPCQQPNPGLMQARQALQQLSYIPRKRRRRTSRHLQAGDTKTNPVDTCGFWVCTRAFATQEDRWPLHGESSGTGSSTLHTAQAACCHWSWDTQAFMVRFSEVSSPSRLLAPMNTLCPTGGKRRERLAISRNARKRAEERAMEQGLDTTRFCKRYENPALPRFLRTTLATVG